MIYNCFEAVAIQLPPAVRARSLYDLAYGSACEHTGLNVPLHHHRRSTDCSDPPSSSARRPSRSELDPPGRRYHRRVRQRLIDVLTIV